MSDWIEWHGGKQPVADDVMVEIRMRDGSEWASAASHWKWDRLPNRELDGDIIAYRIVSQDSELNRLRAELERERMRLAACGVVAAANTPETAAEARKMHDDYRSASCADVEAAVDREMRLRKENAALRKALELALRSHGVLLTSDPPQDAWKYYRVAEVARAALQGAKDD